MANSKRTALNFTKITDKFQTYLSIEANPLIISISYFPRELILKVKSEAGHKVDKLLNSCEAAAV